MTAQEVFAKAYYKALVDLNIFNNVFMEYTLLLQAGVCAI